MNHNTLIKVKKKKKSLSWATGLINKLYIKTWCLCVWFWCEYIYFLLHYILCWLCCNGHFMFIPFDQLHFQGATIAKPRGESTSGLLAHGGAGGLRFAARRCTPLSQLFGVWKLGWQTPHDRYLDLQIYGGTNVQGRHPKCATNRRDNSPCANPTCWQNPPTSNAPF